jgi:cell division protein FtsB
MAKTIAELEAKIAELETKNNEITLESSHLKAEVENLKEENAKLKNTSELSALKKENERLKSEVHLFFIEREKLSFVTRVLQAKIDGYANDPGEAFLKAIQSKQLPAQVTIIKNVNMAVLSSWRKEQEKLANNTRFIQNNIRDLEDDLEDIVSGRMAVWMP